MSTTRQIAHNTIIQIIGKIISVSLGLSALGMMTRYLGTEKFGWYVTTIAFLQFVGIMIDFGLTPVTAQMMSEPNFDKKELLKNLLGFRFVSAIVLLGITPLIALFFPYPYEVKLAISFTTVSFLAIAMNQVFMGYYQMRLKMHIQAIGEVASRVALVLGIWLVMAFGQGFLYIMGIIVLSSVIYTAVLWIVAQRETPTGFGFDWNIWKEIIKKMWPIAISIMFNVVYLKGDTVLLSIFRSQTEVGIYGAAYRVIDILAQIAMMMMGLMLPLLTYVWSRDLKEKFKQRYQQSFDMMMLMALPMTIGVLALAKPIMILVAGPEFADSGKILQILIIAVFGVYLGAVFGHVAVAINKQKQTMWVYITTAILTFTGYFIFIPKYGMLGAAWMTVFSELFVGIFLFLTIRHFVKEKLEMKTLAKILFSALVMGAVLMIFQHLNMFILIPLGILVYGFFIFGFGVVSKETLQKILSLKN